MAKDLTDLIERFEAIEQRFGVRFDALYAVLQDDDLKISGELYALQGETLQQGVDIVVAAYDRRGLVVGRSCEGVDAGPFFGFEPFRLDLDHLPTMKLKKIALYVVGHYEWKCY